MAGSVPQKSESASFESPVRPAWVRWLCGIENSILIVCLFALIFLPLLERVMRGFFNTGIEGEAEFVLHFSLVIGMVGGAIAAREKRLLGISTIAHFLKGPWKIAADVFANSWAAVVTGVLGYAGYLFLLDERGAGNEIAYGVARWWIQSMLPIGFGLIAIRLSMEQRVTMVGEASLIHGGFGS